MRNVAKLLPIACLPFLLTSTVLIGQDEFPLAPLPSPMVAEVDAVNQIPEPLMGTGLRQDACLPTPDHVNFGGCRCPQHSCCPYHALSVRLQASVEIADAGQILGLSRGIL